MHWFMNKYVKGYNKSHQRVGRLFQGPYRAIIVDSNEYKWSSYPIFTGINSNSWPVKTTDILNAFKILFGHCNVPQNWNKNIELSKWVISQRYAYKKMTLQIDKQEKLENIGFDFEMSCS